MKRGVLTALAYVGTIVVANWSVRHYGIVNVGFGLYAPAAVFFVGLALVLRDYVQWALGKAWMLAALAVGIGVSYFAADARLATASAAAFAFSELTDFLLFSWVAPRWARAVFVGGIAGAVVDSLIFLQIAFGSFTFLPGQLVGKSYGVVAATVVIALRRRALLPRHA